MAHLLNSSYHSQCTNLELDTDKTSDTGSRSPHKFNRQTSFSTDDSTDEELPRSIATSSNEESEGGDSDSDHSIVNVRISKLEEEVRAFVWAQRTAAESTHIQNDNINDVRRKKNYSQRYDRMEEEPVAGMRSQKRKKRREEPIGEAKLRLLQASDAFVDQDYAKAAALAMDVVRLNGEISQAWFLLSSIWEEIGEFQKAFLARYFAAQLSPRDVSAWVGCAECALRWLDHRGCRALEIASDCYSAALRVDPRHRAARFGKASVEHHLGRLSKAITHYSVLLDLDPLNLSAARGLAEACLDRQTSSRKMLEKCRATYRRLLTRLLIEGPNQNQVTWTDLFTYSELSSCLGLHTDAIADLKSLGRWLTSRGSDSTWDAWTSDDREWDMEDDRRLLVPEFDPTAYAPETYQLPLDVRLRLIVYRLRAGHEEEAKYQLSCIAKIPEALECAGTPELIHEIAELLFQDADYGNACLYYETLRSRESHQVDPSLLVRLGTCYFALSRNIDAEECFIKAIEEDPDHVEARIELAKIYEQAHEDEEAYLLVNEAIKLCEENKLVDNCDRKEILQGNNNQQHRKKVGESARRRWHPRTKRPGNHADKGVLSRYHPRKLVSAEQRREHEKARTESLAEQYALVQSLRSEAQSGSGPSFWAWMNAARLLVDDFRSFKEFYKWERYLGFLKRTAEDGQFKQRMHHTNHQLADMAERLTKRNLSSI